MNKENCKTSERKEWFASICFLVYAYALLHHPQVCALSQASTKVQKIPAMRTDDSRETVCKQECCDKYRSPCDKCAKKSEKCVLFSNNAKSFYKFDRKIKVVRVKSSVHAFDSRTTAHLEDVPIDVALSADAIQWRQWSNAWHLNINSESFHFLHIRKIAEPKQFFKPNLQP